MSDRALQLAAYVRRLPDHDLNDLLVELPRERFAARHGCLARPRLTRWPPRSRARPRPGEATRWDVLTGEPGRRIGAVVRRTWLRVDGRETAIWFPYNSTGSIVEPPGSACAGRLRAGRRRRAPGLAESRIGCPMPGLGRSCPCPRRRRLGRSAGRTANRAVRRPPRAALNAHVRAGEAV